MLLHLFASYDSEGHVERSCLVGEIKRLKTLKKVVFSPVLSVWCTRHPANTVFLYLTLKCKLYKLWKCARSLSEFTALWGPCEQINTFPSTHYLFSLKPFKFTYLNKPLSSIYCKDLKVKTSCHVFHFSKHPLLTSVTSPLVMSNA